MNNRSGFDPLHIAAKEASVIRKGKRKMDDVTIRASAGIIMHFLPIVYRQPVVVPFVIRLLCLPFAGMQVAILWPVLLLDHC